MGRSKFWRLFGTGLVLSCDFSDPVGAENETDDGELASSALIDLESWVLVSRDDDPWVDHRPDEFVCPKESFGLESLGFEVNTGDCEYFTAKTPLLRAIDAHQRIGVSFYHRKLRSAQAAVAHVAFQLGQEKWEKEVAIPADATVYEFVWDLPKSLPLGEELYFHVHNHGYNSWVVHRIESDWK